MVAYGAAISLESMFENRKRILDTGELLETLTQPFLSEQRAARGSEARPFFASEEEKAAFEKRHAEGLQTVEEAPAGREGATLYLGIDSGSTTTKFVLMDEKEEILDSFYAPNEGEPLHGGQESHDPDAGPL